MIFSSPVPIFGLFHPLLGQRVHHGAQHRHLAELGTSLQYPQTISFGLILKRAPTDSVPTSAALQVERPLGESDAGRRGFHYRATGNGKRRAAKVRESGRQARFIPITFISLFGQNFTYVFKEFKPIHTINMIRNFMLSWNLLHEVVFDDSAQVPCHDGMILGQVLDVLRKYIFLLQIASV